MDTELMLRAEYHMAKGTQASLCARLWVCVQVWVCFSYSAVQLTYE